jgi:hypothetical protein
MRVDLSSLTIWKADINTRYLYGRLHYHACRAFWFLRNDIIINTNCEKAFFYRKVDLQDLIYYLNELNQTLIQVTH